MEIIKCLAQLPAEKREPQRQKQSQTETEKPIRARRHCLAGPPRAVLG